MHRFRSFIWFVTHTWAVIRALGSRKDVRNSCFNVGAWVMATQTFQLQTRFCYTGQDPWFIYFAFTKILKVLLSQEILVFAFTKEPSRDLMVLLCVCGKTGLKSVSRSKPNTNILNWEMITKILILFAPTICHNSRNSMWFNPTQRNLLN